jgi:predicted nucleic-acid-binding Zn-ribbon protein
MLRAVTTISEEILDILGRVVLALITCGYSELYKK